MLLVFDFFSLHNTLILVCNVYKYDVYEYVDVAQNTMRHFIQQINYLKLLFRQLFRCIVKAKR